MSHHHQHGPSHEVSSMPGQNQLPEKRSRAVLSEAELQRARQNGEALFYDPVQLGWVRAPAADDLYGLYRFRNASLNQAASARPIPVVALKRQIDTLTSRIFSGASKLMALNPSGSVEKLCLDEIDLLIKPWRNSHSVTVLDRSRSELQSHAIKRIAHLKDGEAVSSLPGSVDAPGVVFREWESGDFETYRTFLNDAAMWQWIPDTMPEPFDEEIARQLLDLAMSRSRHFVQAVEVDGHLCGQVRLLFDPVVSGGRSAEISFWIARPFWGRGYMKRILAKFLPQACSGHDLELIYAWIHPENVGSVKAVEASGFLRDRWAQESELARVRKIEGFQRYKYFCKSVIPPAKAVSA